MMGSMYTFVKAQILIFLLILEKSYSQVYILSENLEQGITSTTLYWKTFVDRDDFPWDYAVVAAYQMTGGDANSTADLTGTPVYVCRAIANGIWVSGHLKQESKQCVVSIFNKLTKARQQDHFEVLVNLENRGRLSWVNKNKYSLLPAGSVEGGDKIYVARRKVNFHKREAALTHIVGYCNPGENFGLFHLLDQNNKELNYEDGDILVEKEPINYEFKNTKFNNIKAKYKMKREVLGSTVLKNEIEGVQRVDTVMSYNYSHYIYWGKGHGLLVGNPFSVVLPNGTKIMGKWTISQTNQRFETVPIEKYLPEGTAVNVTLFGNYTESDVPYTTIVKAVFKDNETLESPLEDNLIEHYVGGVTIEFSPVYFLHNNSLIPTTTKATTIITKPPSTQPNFPVTITDSVEMTSLEGKTEEMFTDGKNTHPDLQPLPDDNEIKPMNKEEQQMIGEQNNNPNAAYDKEESLFLILFLSIIAFVQVT